MKKTEIEKKFLLKCPPNIKGHKRELLIDQFYTEDKIRYRRTIEEGKSDLYEKIIKTNVSIGVNEEEDFTTTQQEFDKLQKQSKRRISKLRFVYEHGGLKFEVDKFLNLTLTVCEVELDNITQPIIFPDYISGLVLMDVTGNKKFNNSNLAT